MATTKVIPSAFEIRVAMEDNTTILNKPNAAWSRQLTNAGLRNESG
jgi:hypothetical protein